MRNTIKLKKCMKCGAIVEVLKDCTCDDCGIKCCGESMRDIVSNSEDASFEKHVPNYEIVDNYVIAYVNHVMEEDHYIEYIALYTDKNTIKKYLKPNEEAKVIFPYVKGSTLYAYCNKHGMWKSEIK